MCIQWTKRVSLNPLDRQTDRLTKSQYFSIGANKSTLPYKEKQDRKILKNVHELRSPFTNTWPTSHIFQNILKWNHIQCNIKHQSPSTSHTIQTYSSEYSYSMQQYSPFTTNIPHINWNGWNVRKHK